MVKIFRLICLSTIATAKVSSTQEAVDVAPATVTRLCSSQRWVGWAELHKVSIEMFAVGESPTSKPAPVCEVGRCCTHLWLMLFVQSPRTQAELFRQLYEMERLDRASGGLVERQLRIQLLAKHGQPADASSVRAAFVALHLSASDEVRMRRDRIGWLVDRVRPALAALVGRQALEAVEPERPLLCRRYRYAGGDRLLLVYCQWGLPVARERTLPKRSSQSSLDGASTAKKARR